MTTERIYIYPDGTRHRLVGERGPELYLPGRHPVDRAALVALLDAWQAYNEAHEPGITVEGEAYAAAMRHDSQDALLDALADFADGVEGL